MIVDGHVWRLIDDPVYFVDPLPSLPGSDPRVHVLSQRKEAEKFASFSQFDPPAPMPDRLVPARSAHEWMASTSPMVSAARFRADDKAEAELYAKQMGHLAFEANIDVRRPERVLATPAALQMKVAAIGFARMFDAQGRQALWGYPAASVADIIDAAKRIVETKKSSAMPAKSDVGLILAFEVGDGEHAKMRDKRDWWLRRLKVSIERVERDTSRGHSTKSFSPDDERSLVALGAA
jgi:hypothetical protein